MLHEVLLALAGHQSPLFDSACTENFPYVTSSESELLNSLGRLASLHRALKSHTSRIADVHTSFICRAVGRDIAYSHLLRFRQAVLDVERRILSDDASNVGAYNIVPLASIVGELGSWRRVLEWCWDLALFILPVDGEATSELGTPRKDGLRNGAALINKLRQDINTGYPDVESAARQLLSTSEMTWMRQLSAWLLEGKVSKYALCDSFVQPTGKHSTIGNDYHVQLNLLPNFLNVDVANSILYIGKTLNYLDGAVMGEGLGGLSLVRRSTTSISSRLENVRRLTYLTSPLSSNALATAVSEMRASLTRQITYGILPVQSILDTLSSLQDFFLSRRVDFTDALITEADGHLRQRHTQARLPGSHSGSTSLAGAMMKENEVSTVLSRTWNALAPGLNNDENLDDQMEWARENLRLSLAKPSAAGDRTMQLRSEDQTLQHELRSSEGIFDEFLLSAPTQLHLVLKPPMSLFLHQQELQSYAAMHSYLLSIRRANLHLSALWRRNLLRKSSPVLAGSSKSSKYRLESSKRSRERGTKREKSLRPIWAALSRTIFFLNELGQYLSFEVADQSWVSFQRWVHTNPNETNLKNQRQASRTFSNVANALPTEELLHSTVNTNPSNPLAQDPEILSTAHRQYLSSLLSSLLLTNPTYTTVIRDLLHRIDHLASLVIRIENIFSNVDLQDEGVMEEDGPSARNYVQEEGEVHQEMKNAADRVKSGMAGVIEVLRGIDAEKYESQEGARKAKIRVKTGFEPWNGGHVDRLLLRLGGAEIAPVSIEDT